MISARAVTNAIGNNTGPWSEAITCKTESFKIQPSGKGTKQFPPEEDCEHGKSVRLGDLLGHERLHLAMIGLHLYENGVGLGTPLDIVKTPKRYTEVWSGRNRYQYSNGQVYGHRRKI